MMKCEPVRMDPRKQILKDLRSARDLVNSTITATIAEAEEFPTSSRELPESMWDALQWLGYRVCQGGVVDQVKAKQVAMILTGNDQAEADAWVADLVVAVTQYDKMYGPSAYVPTPFPI